MFSNNILSKLYKLYNCIGLASKKIWPQNQSQGSIFWNWDLY